MADASQLADLRMDTKSTLKASDIRIDDFSIDTTPKSRASMDILERFNSVVSQASQSKGTSSISLNAVDVDFDSLCVDFGDERPESKLLQKARNLIGANQYEPALAALNDVFAIAPQHSEGTYLKAFCEHHLGNSKKSLTTLRELTGVALSNRLQTRMRMLRDEIRNEMLPRAQNIFTLATSTQQTGQSAEELTAIIDIDPGFGQYHCFLAGVLIVDKKFAEARAVIEQGIKVCDSGEKELQELRADLDQRLLPNLLAPARDRFLQKQYAQALRELEKAPAEIREMPLWRSFHELLTQRTGKGSGGLFARLLGGTLKSSTVTKHSSAMQELCEYLAERPMKSARSACKNKDYLKAEQLLTEVVNLLPDFCAANYMLATSVYQRVAEKVKERIGKDIDDAESLALKKSAEALAGARTFAEIGGRDPALKDSRRLVKSIDEMCRQIETVVKAHEDQSHDAKIVNELIDQFIDLLVKLMMFNSTVQALASSGNAYQLRNSAEELFAKLTSMRSNLSALRGRCRGAKAREIIDLVRDNFVEPNYSALKTAMGK